MTTLRFRYPYGAFEQLMNIVYSPPIIFETLRLCVRIIESTIENHSVTERISLCGRS